MKTLKPTILALSLLAAFASTGVHAQSNEALLKEMKALRERMEQLEKKLAEQQSAKPAEPKWGMTPEQTQEFNRIAVKTEAIEDSLETLGHKNLKITGFADPTYIYNRRQHRAGFQFLNPVGAGDGYNYDNSYFGVVSLDLLKEMDNGTKWHLTLVPGRGTAAVTNLDNSIVQEASVMVPLGDLNHRIIAGHLPDWSGYEYQPATQNKLISHNLLFDFTLPTSYTGAGFEVVDGKWDVKAMLANVNMSKVQAGRSSPTFVGRVDYSKGEFNGWGSAVLLGKMPNFTGNVLDAQGNTVAQPDSFAGLFEVDGYFIRGDWTVQGQLSYGTQKKASITPAADGSLRDAQWYGASALAAYKFIPRWEATARLDYLHNSKNGGGLLGYTAADGRNGIGPSQSADADAEIGANRAALSLGLSYLFNEKTTLKVETRWDHADQPVFYNTGNGLYGKDNLMFGTAMVVAF